MHCCRFSQVFNYFAHRMLSNVSQEVERLKAGKLSCCSSGQHFCLLRSVKYFLNFLNFQETPAKILDKFAVETQVRAL